MSNLPPELPQPCMRDVARACGVHASTVSRALRNDRSIPAATRTRIRERAQSMGYRPHPLVSALVAMRRTRKASGFRATIALLQFEGIPGRTPEYYENGVRRAAEHRGYRVETFMLGPSGLRPSRVDSILRARNIPGVIIGPLPEAHGHFDLDWASLCTVALEYTYTPALFDRVVHDSFDAMQQVVQQCRRRGIHRLGILLSTVAHERTEQKITAAYWAAHEQGGIERAVPPLVLPAWNVGPVDTWYDRHRPEALVVSNTFLPQARAWSAARRLRLARDIHLVNLNADRDGPIAGIYQAPEIIGATAARLAIDRITHNDRGLPEHPLTVHLQGTWREGSTIRPADS